MRSFCYLKYTFNKTLYYSTKNSKKRMKHSCHWIFFFSTKPNFPRGPLIKGNSVYIKAKHAWISWCKTTCTLIAVVNICMFKACIFPALFCPLRLAFIHFCSAFHTVRNMIRCAQDNLPKRFRCTCRIL